MRASQWKWAAVAAAILGGSALSCAQPRPGPAAAGPGSASRFVPESVSSPAASPQPVPPRPGPLVSPASTTTPVGSLAPTSTRLATAATVPVIEAVSPAYREQVGKVLAKPTLTTRYTEDRFLAHATVYEWLLHHPDRVSLAWQRMNIPCVEIRSPRPGTFVWNDDHGSQLMWSVVGQAPGQVIWYASGKVKATLLLPVIPVQAVIVVRYAGQPTSDAGVSEFAPEVTLWLQTESRAAAAIMRIAGPAMPKMAEQGAEQLLFFFSGVATYIHLNPDKLAMLLGPKREPSPRTP